MINRMGKDLGAKEEKEQLTGEQIRLNALAANRQATQFGGERANPHHSEANAAKPWSYRSSIRDMAHRKIVDGDDIETMTEGEIIKRVLPTKTPTLVQIGAARELARLAKGNGNPQFVTEQLDGKLAQTNINAGLAEIMRMSDDELDEILRGDDTETAESRSEGGENAPTGSAGNAPNEDESPGQAGDPAGL